MMQHQVQRYRQRNGQTRQYAYDRCPHLRNILRILQLNCVVLSADQTMGAPSLSNAPIAFETPYLTSTSPAPHPLKSHAPPPQQSGQLSIRPILPLEPQKVPASAGSPRFDPR